MPAHWSEAYLGRQYDKEAYNCGDLVLDIQRDQYNRAVDIAIEHKDYDWKEMTALIAEETPKHTVRVDAPEEGDVALINNGARLKHVGVYIVCNQIPCIIHNMAKAGVVIHPVSSFGKGLLETMTVDSYYRVN